MCSIRHVCASIARTKDALNIVRARWQTQQLHRTVWILVHGLTAYAGVTYMYVSIVDSMQGPFFGGSLTLNVIES